MQTRPSTKIEVKAIVDKTYANISPKIYHSSLENVQTSTHINIL